MNDLVKQKCTKYKSEMKMEDNIQSMKEHETFGSRLVPTNPFLRMMEEEGYDSEEVGKALRKYSEPQWKKDIQYYIIVFVSLLCIIYTLFD